MQCYLVGGAVRDQLLGLPVQDRDFVVVGSTPEAMLAQGFIAVGKDFPVFLHPHTHEEYALARTERKTAPGYAGFVFHAAGDVTLEQDLARRDLTINAMAQAGDGSLIDPFGGLSDLRRGVLRHVSPAFAEDPVRILRAARFAARFAQFALAPETAELLRLMVANGEVDALVPERVWQEVSRGLMEGHPSRMILLLQECGALGRLLPELAQWWLQADAGAGIAVACHPGTILLTQLDAAAQAGAGLPLRLAVLLQVLAAPMPVRDRAHDEDRVADSTAIAAACVRLKVPGPCRDLACLTGRERGLLQAGPHTACAALALFERCDALRKPARFAQGLEVLGFLDDSTAAHGVLAHWRRLLDAARSVDAGAIAAQVQHQDPGKPMQINAAVRAARQDAIARVIVPEVSV